MIPARLAALWIPAVILMAGEAAAAPRFIRGDADASGTSNLGDPVAILRHLFHGDLAAVRCRDAADVDDDGRLELTDAVYLLTFLFLGGAPPMDHDPLLLCEPDGTEDLLDCEAFEPCSSVGLFFSIDRSGRVNLENYFQRIKDEVIRRIGGLSDGDQLAVVFFDNGLLKFPAGDLPADTTPPLKEEAINRTLSAVPGNESCPHRSLIACLTYARRSTARHKEIIHFDLGYHCLEIAPYHAEVIAEVTQRNTQQVRITTVGVGLEREADEEFLQELSEANGGSYTSLDD